MDYLIRDIALSEIRQCCPNKIGFEKAFSQATIFFISDLINCIYHNVSMNRSTYDEPLDFLNGNGFKVEGNDTDGYTISLLNN